MARQRIAANLKRLRLQQGWSQEMLAERADFHRTYVSQLERCVTNISIDGLERLAQALTVDVRALLAVDGETGDTRETRTAVPSPLTVHEPAPMFQTPASQKSTPRRKPIAKR